MVTARLISRRSNYRLLLLSFVVTTHTFHLLFGPFHVAAPLPTPSSQSVWSAPYVWTPAAIPLFDIPLFAVLAVPPPPARQRSVINIFVITQGRVTSATTLRFLAPCDRVPIQISWLGKKRSITQNTKRATRPFSGCAFTPAELCVVLLQKQGS